jgi:Flp pilus assembly pilin Flp
MLRLSEHAAEQRSLAGAESRRNNMRKLVKLIRSRKSGQTMTEYIVIVVVVACAALAIFGAFSDTIRQKLSGTVSTFDSGANATAAQAAVAQKSEDVLQKLDDKGGGITGSSSSGS